MYLGAPRISRVLGQSVIEAQLHGGEYEAAEKDCTVALERRPAYAKVLLRRAEACDHLAAAAIAKEEHVEASGKLQTVCRRSLALPPGRGHWSSADGKLRRHRMSKQGKNNAKELTVLHGVGWGSASARIGFGYGPRSLGCTGMCMSITHKA